MAAGTMPITLKLLAAREIGVQFAPAALPLTAKKLPWFPLGELNWMPVTGEIPETVIPTE
jgi:hypothetical protein